MAKTEATKKKKKGLVERMMFGDDTKPDLTPERAQMSKWAMFKFLFFGRFGTMVLLNLLTALFALPAAAVMVLSYLNSTVAASYVPYSSNLGFGYPIVVDAIAQGTLMSFTYEILEYLLLVPCLAVFALGLAGNFYVMRKLIWEESTRTVKDFFRGIKKCWGSALFIGFALGFTILLVVFSLGYFDAYRLSTGLKALSVTLSIILLVFMLLFSAFFITQSAAFKMRPMVLMRNSVLFVLGTNVQAIFFVGLALAPAYLAFIPGITVILVMIYVFLGFSFTTLVISLFAHYCYEKFLYDKIDGGAPVYQKRTNDLSDDGDADKKVAAKKKTATPYKNPKKRKKSIDEGASITPLTPTFRREDLERLEKEHEKVMQESEEDELGSLDDETDDINDDELGSLDTAPDGTEDTAVNEPQDGAAGDENTAE